MRLIHSIVPITFGLLAVITLPPQVAADQMTDSGAARYIRTLFDATLPVDRQDAGGLAEHCADVEPIGHFAAGRLWQALSDAERAKFNRAFCDLADTAVNRLRNALPGLRMVVTESRPAPQDMIFVHAVVTTPDGRQWPVDWLIRQSPDRLYVADLRILGVSLGIFLRSLAALERQDKAVQPLTADAVLRPWALALDHALPADTGISPR